MERVEHVRRNPLSYLVALTGIYSYTLWETTHREAQPSQDAILDVREAHIAIAAAEARLAEQSAELSRLEMLFAALEKQRALDIQLQAQQLTHIIGNISWFCRDPALTFGSVLQPGSFLVASHCSP